MPRGIIYINTTFIDFLLRFYNIIQKISSNSLAVLEIFNSEKSSYLIGPNLPCQGKPRGTIVIKTTFAVFLLWFYNIIQKMKSNGQAVLEIFKFEKSSNLIGPYQSCQGKPRGTTVIKNTFIDFLLWMYNSIQKISPNGPAVLEIFKFEKSSDLIG